MAIEFPYGLADYRALIKERYLYIDRTDRIPLIEQAGRQLILLRPRRFGKTLWLSLLENYYDLARADEFDELFGHLAIGKNPTPKRNQYFILKWDFSSVSPQGDAETIKDNLHGHINVQIRNFCLRYKHHLSAEVKLHPTNAALSLESLVAVTQDAGHPLYLLIDEYDNFANEVMMSRQQGARDRYEALLYGEGALKSLFKTVKAISAGMGLERVFITGVSPIAMSDVSSAYNVAENISADPALNDLCGFRETEVATIVQNVADSCSLTAVEADQAMEMMQVFYNGYRFSREAQERIYNPTLAIYFLKHLQRHCRYPRKLLDENLATDRLKLDYVSRLPGGPEILSQVLDREQPLAIAELSERFGVADILNASRDGVTTATLLFYLGMLTLSTEVTEQGETTLNVPNLTAKDLYLERLRELHLGSGEDSDEIRAVTKPLYSQGDLQPLCAFIERKRLQLFDNRDYASANELTIKTVFLMLLAGNLFYILDSETELARGYADLTMIVRPDMRQYQLLDILIEFKYLSLERLKLSGRQLREMPQEALEQLPEVARQRHQAEAALTEYRTALENKYAGALRLRCFSVVTLGFERLLWAKY
ncbi:AAA family ATPase [Lamprobacter modestohalophilus]|uniref:AAA family ATPase n=1 Tax=Lamprobacter modestohalophilus TaxID=1064514 RepID=UPI001A92C517|nr:AAA family ATPase [Lamprobacter modestohalophilus]